MDELKITFRLNGATVSVSISPEMSLLTVLKDILHINSVKRSCLEGECGACTVIANGKAMNSCLILAATIDGKSVETVESLGTPGDLHPIQKAIIEHGASQCGFCTPGLIMSIKALLDENQHPTEYEIRRAIAGNLCRCTGYVKPVNAIMQLISETYPSAGSAEAAFGTGNCATTTESAVSGDV